VVCHESVELGSAEGGYVVKPSAELGANKLKVKEFWLRAGTFKSEPVSHASCFNCHWTEGGVRPLANDCGGCHSLPQNPGIEAVRHGAGGDSPPADKARLMGITPDRVAQAEMTARDVLNIWTDREVGAFWHDQKSHAGTACTSCHVDMKDRPQYVPIKTCATSSCHGSTSGRGSPSPPSRGIPTKSALYVELKEKEKDPAYQCAYCHINNGSRPAPESHKKLF
jgi:hypothetical protein